MTRLLGMCAGCVTLLGGMWSASVHAEYALIDGEPANLFVAALSACIAVIGFGVLDTLFFRDEE